MQPNDYLSPNPNPHPNPHIQRRLTSRDEAMVGASSVESLLKCMGVENDQKLLAQLKTLYKYDPKTNKKLSVATVYNVAKYLHLHYLSHLSEKEAMYQLGYRAMLEFRNTVFGRIVLASLGVVSQEYSIKLFPKMLASNVNFGKRSITKLAPGYWELLFEDDPGDLHVTLGIVAALLEMINIPKPQLELVPLQPNYYKVLIRY
jgi:uncharacterized protein (TIGR02265 family)